MKPLCLACVICLVTGCMTTRHVEQTRVVNVGVDTQGNYSYTNDATQNVRQWTGPWVVQPCRAQP